MSKNDALPAEWLKATYSDDAQRQAILDRHDLGQPPASAAEFLPFYSARRERIRVRLAKPLWREPVEAAINAT